MLALALVLGFVLALAPMVRGAAPLDADTVHDAARAIRAEKN